PPQSRPGLNRPGWDVVEDLAGSGIPDSKPAAGGDEPIALGSIGDHAGPGISPRRLANPANRQRLLAVNLGLPGEQAAAGHQQRSAHGSPLTGSEIGGILMITRRTRGVVRSWDQVGFLAKLIHPVLRTSVPPHTSACTAIPPICSGPIDEWHLD